MATTVTGQQIRQQLASILGGVMEIGQQVGASGSATTIVDAGNLKGRNLPSSMYDNAQVRVTSGMRAGETTYVDYLDPATGTLYLDPALTGALADGDEYEVWMKGVDPDWVDRLRDDVLQFTVSTWRQNPVTIITDGDLEMPGVTHWNIVGSATRTKSLGGAPDVKSRWQLAIVHTTAASDFIDSDAIDCQPGEYYYFEAPVKAYVTATGAVATASMVPQDVTNTAAITVGGQRTTHAGRGWGRLGILFTIPTGCYQFKLRFKSDTAASTTVWGGMCLMNVRATEITLPDRIRTKRRVGKTFLTTQVRNSAQVVNNTRMKLPEYHNVERNQIGSNVVLFFYPQFGQQVVYYYERGYFARLSAAYVTPAQRLVGDAATTDAPLEYAGAALAEKVTKLMLDKFGADWQDDWARASAMLNYWEGEFGPEPQRVHESETPVSIPNLRV
jgi:hypothetical protein